MSERFAKRRAAVLERLAPASALVLCAAPEVIVGRDTELRYVVDAELFYLTGYTEPEAVLVMAPYNQDAPFTMFVRPRDPARELWTGGRAGEAGAMERFGANAAYAIAELPQRLPALLAGADVVYSRLDGHSEVDSAILRILSEARRSRPRTGRSPHTITDPGELLDQLRIVKSDVELELIREAARISCAAFLETLARIRVGIGEWEVEALIEYGFRSRDADGPAFPTIAAAGANATVLHYTENRAVAREGDMMLLDAGARYRMYCADITRTVPVSGTFSAAQRDLYDVVLAAHDAAVQATRVGVLADAPHNAAQRVLADGLIALGYLNGPIEAALEDENGLRRFFPHRTSHWLGLEVHDVGSYATKAGSVALQENMVLTIEPGLYMPHIGIGIRIEDDVVVRADGPEVLTARIPTNAAEIESLVRGGA